MNSAWIGCHFDVLWWGNNINFSNCGWLNWIDFTTREEMTLLALNEENENQMLNMTELDAESSDGACL